MHRNRIVGGYCQGNFCCDGVQAALRDAAPVDVTTPALKRRAIFGCPPDACGTPIGNDEIFSGLPVESRNNSDEIGEHAVGGGVEAGIFFGDGQAGEDVGFEIDVGRCAGDFAHGAAA